MKKTLVSFALCFLPVMAVAQVKIIDLNHPQVVTGVFSDFQGHKDGGAALALVTYGAGVPLAVGGTLGRGLGGPSVALGTMMNLLPAIKDGGMAIIKALYPDDAKFANLKGILAPPIGGKPDISMSFGPCFSYVFNNGLKGKGVWTLFYGAAWSF